MITTELQDTTLQAFAEMAEGKYSRAIAQAYFASLNIHPLPHLNEKGEKIQHGANQAIRSIRDHWLTIADQWERHISEESRERILGVWPKINKNA